jgi:uncharacterized protein (TIGR02646 family)
VIHINLDGKHPPAKWLAKAKTLTQALNNACSDEKRCQIIKQNQKLWGELKQWLLEQSQNKCWYTEARNDSSHFEVEHFRPKKWNDDTHEGYWWLSFEWTNYRVCGNAPNRKKGAFFPLHPDSNRASSDRRHMVEDEIYCLLDPTDPSDPLLLSFNESGDAVPCLGINGWEKRRAQVSIDRYGLNHLPQLSEGRRKVWQECRMILDELLVLHDKNQKNPTSACRTSIKEKTKQLLAKIKSDQPFSAVAKQRLSVSGISWAQKIATS